MSTKTEKEARVNATQIAFDWNDFFTQTNDLGSPEKHQIEVKKGCVSESEPITIPKNETLYGVCHYFIQKSIWSKYDFDSVIIVDSQNNLVFKGVDPAIHLTWLAMGLDTHNKVNSCSTKLITNHNQEKTRVLVLEMKENSNETC